MIGGVRLMLLWEAIRVSYWFVPAILCCGGGGLAFVLVALDRSAVTDGAAGFWWVFGGGAEGARTLLSTVAGSVITVAGVTFSVTMAVLSLTSSQFGPRLLRGFLRDAANQAVLGTFLGTFLYCLLVLRTVRSVEERYFVPHLAVSAGVALALASLFALVFFIHHVTATVQISRIVGDIAGELEAAIERLFPDRIGRGAARAYLSEESPEVLTGVPRAFVVQSGKGGYVQAVDGDALLALALGNDLRVWVRHRPGTFVGKGAVLAVYAPRSGSLPPPGSGLALEGRIRRTFTIGDQRTAAQDAAFLFQQLAEVAERALSPGVNDPNTAIMCLDRLGAGLAHLAERRMPSPYRRDEVGIIRLVAPPLTFAEAAETCFGGIRTYGRGDPRVMRRLLTVLGEVSFRTGSAARRRTLAEQAARAWQAARTALPPGEPTEEIEEAYRAVLRWQDEGDGGDFLR